MSMASWQCSGMVKSFLNMRKLQSSKGVFEIVSSPLTCRLSTGGITMTKLSGNKPQRPFSSPSHQPSSSVSYRCRLERHIRKLNHGGVLWDVKLLQRLPNGQRKMAAFL